MNLLYTFFLTLLVGFAAETSSCDIGHLTLEEKVGQLFMTYFDSDNADDLAASLIRETKIGGIIYYSWANGLDDPSKIQQLSNNLQKLARDSTGIPLFISVDQEGGAVSTIQSGVTDFPGNAALGRTDDPGLSYGASYFMGKELKVLGINMNLAPVVDVNVNPMNPIIGIRSYGQDPEKVTSFADASIRGFKDSGVVPCLKHFPGHGDVVQDSHKVLPVVDKGYQEIDGVELLPFRKLAKKAPVIMTAHVLYPQVDPDRCATLSPTFLKEILRDKMRFQGVLMTDSLTMGAVLKEHKGLEEIVCTAFEAGNDVLLIGGRDRQLPVDGKENVQEVIRAYKSLLKAVREGRITEERVNASVRRILGLKKEMGLFSRSCPTPEDLEATLKKAEHLQLAREIADKSLQTPTGKFDVDLANQSIAIVAPRILESKIRTTRLRHLGNPTDLVFFEDLSPTHEESRDIVDRIRSMDYVIFCSYDCWKNSGQLGLLQTICQEVATVCIATKDPQDLDADFDCETKIATYSPTSCALEAAADWLLGITSTAGIHRRTNRGGG